MELNLPCLVATGQGSSGYKIVEEFLPEAAKSGDASTIPSQRGDPLSDSNLSSCLKPLSQTTTLK